MWTDHNLFNQSPDRHLDSLCNFFLLKTIQQLHLSKLKFVYLKKTIVTEWRRFLFGGSKNILNFFFLITHLILIHTTINLQEDGNCSNCLIIFIFIFNTFLRITYSTQK